MQGTIRSCPGANLIQIKAAHSRECNRSAMDIQLDLRDLPPPEPMVRILDALELLQPGQRLEAMTPYRPLPLLPMLEKLGYAWQVEDTASGHARLLIRHRDDDRALP